MKKEYWAGAIVGLGVLDWYCAHVRQEGTLSEAGRVLFHTDTPLGKTVWTVSWLGLSAWLVPHIRYFPEDLAERLKSLS